MAYCNHGMGQLSLSLLGFPTAQFNGQAIQFVTRKAQALLCYLAVEGVPVARAKLIDLLWTDMDLTRGRLVLRTTLSQMRTRLKDPYSDETSPISYILAQGDSLSFNPQVDVALDVRVLEAASTLARNPKTHGLATNDFRRTLERAAALYHADFLEGFSVAHASEFETWVSLQREKWHQCLSRVLDQLSQLQFEGGEFAAGIATTQRWLTHEPLNEIGHRRLMQLYQASGDRAAALQAYATCRTILLQELNANPSPDTQALGERIRAQVQQTSAVGTLESASPRVSAPPLVDRTHEHGLLVQAYRTARQGQPQGIVVSGEPGMGKTRLVQEFLGWASAQGSAVLRGTALEMAVRLPYQIWIDALREQFTQPLGRQTFDSLDASWRTAITRLWPELQTLHPAELARASSQTVEEASEQAEVEIPTGRNHLFEAIFQFTERLTCQSSQHVPLVIFFDDIQWADTVSLDLLQYVAYRWRENQIPILLVMTLRTEAADALETSLMVLRRHIPLEVVTLLPLTRQGSDQLVQALLTQTFKQALQAPSSNSNYGRQIELFAQTLFNETAGHPLYLIETCKSLFETVHPQLEQESQSLDLTQWQAVLDGWLAPGVKAVIEARLNRLSPRARAWVNVVAVIGPHAPFEVCRQVADLNESEALTLLDETTARGLLRESIGGTLSFTHDKIREVVYARINPLRRERLHRRAAETLEQHYAHRLDDYAPHIAQHFAALNDSRAQAYFQRAGDAAARLYAYAEAATHFARAIEIALNQENRLPAHDDVHRDAQIARRSSLTSLHFKQVSMHNQLAEYESSLEVLSRLASLARQWDDPALEHMTRVWIAPLLATPGPHMKLVQAQTMAEHVLSQAQITHSVSDEMHAIQTLMRVALWSAHFERAWHYGQTVLSMAREQPSSLLLGYILIDLTMVALFRNEFESMQRYEQEVLRIWPALDRPAMVVFSLALVTRRVVCVGDYERAIAASKEAFNLSERIDNDWARMMSGAHVGWAYFERGQPERAIAVMKESIRLSQTGKMAISAIMTSVDLAGVYGHLYRVSEGLEIAHSAYETAELHMPEWRVYMIPSLVQLYTSQGDLSKADAWLTRGRAFLQAGGDWPAVQISLDAAEATLALTRSDGAHALLLSAACVRSCRAQGWRQYLPKLLLLKARALQNQGHLDDAVIALQEACEEATALQAQWSLQNILAEQQKIAM